MQHSDLASASRRLEVWGGVECSVTRLGERWRDQIRETGHYDRLDDLDRIASLGIRTLRYPVLWEQVHAEGWDWLDTRMARLSRLDVAVVAGLVHHGSGPPGTSLLDADFPDGLARHADQAAARYPHILRWTPVNEPLTTARFSCLYGVWYPHARGEADFLRATALQCRAVLLAMRAIRRRIPGAQLVQTEDVGRCFSTPVLQHQADYDNGRRWLSLDLLCGRVDRAHPWRARLQDAGVSADHLDELAEGEGRPDLIGANYYVTSERFLDHRTALYPKDMRGGNGRQTYVDTEAVRVQMPLGPTGWYARLREVWERYGLPMAVTEAQLGGACEAEQLRWFMEAWCAADALRRDAVPVQAVTAWAMVGAVDWDSLMQRGDGHYEAGVWNSAGDPATPRLIAAALQSLSAKAIFDHPCLHEPGWWRRTDRFHARLRSA